LAALKMAPYLPVPELVLPVEEAGSHLHAGINQMITSHQTQSNGMCCNPVASYVSHSLTRSDAISFGIQTLSQATVSQAKGSQTANRL